MNVRLWTTLLHAELQLRQ